MMKYILDSKEARRNGAGVSEFEVDGMSCE